MPCTTSEDCGPDCTCNYDQLNSVCQTCDHYVDINDCVNGGLPSNNAINDCIERCTINKGKHYLFFGR